MSEPVPARLRGTVVTVFVVGLALGSCISRAPFACDDDIECQRDGSNGTCAAPGYCAHRDDECPSGLRFGRFAAELAETCVEVLAEGSGSSVGSTGGPRSTDSGDASTSSSSGEPPAPPEICDGIDNDGDGLVDE
ncbi:MAG: hypothetical protein K0V04_23570 [Deltaproteobacteria bacterium]|nr:hypothetical protein [Deltaproteobacteria bacterium]